MAAPLLLLCGPARTVAMAREEVRALLASPLERVVVDDTLCFRFLRDDFARLARDSGRDSVLLVLRTPEEELRRRISANAREVNRPGVHPAVLDRHLATFEWPQEDETHRLADDVAGVDAWLAAESARW